MTRAEAYAVVRRMGELEALGATRTDPLPHEEQAVAALTLDECNRATSEGFARYRPRRTA